MRRTRIVIAESDATHARWILSALAEDHLDSEAQMLRDGPALIDFLRRQGAGPGGGSDRPSLVLFALEPAQGLGLETLQALRGDASLPRMPVVVIADPPQAHDRAASYRLGANAFVRKPAEAVAFRDLIRHLVRFWLCVNEPPPGCLSRVRLKSSPGSAS